MTPLEALLQAYKEHAPQVDIWRRYPDVTEQEDDATDQWACDEVSRSFAAFARTRGWDAVIIHCSEAENPWADYHVWVRLTRPGTPTVDVDWTVRQYHNLPVEGGHGPDTQSLPWPLMWDPEVRGDEHPLAGKFGRVRYLREQNLCPNCGQLARNDGSEYNDVCHQWPRCKEEEA